MTILLTILISTLFTIILINYLNTINPKYLVIETEDFSEKEEKVLYEKGYKLLYIQKTKNLNSLYICIFYKN